jgi:polysaccharide deacetylase 2 family uncharacterized protein YibQ
MARGGKRKGAGRPIGSPNKLTTKRLEEAEKEKLPISAVRLVKIERVVESGKVLDDLSGRRTS